VNDTPYVPPGHPVRWFALAVVATAALLAGGWALGFGAPRARVSADQGSFDRAARTGEVTFTVRNQGQLQSRLLSVEAGRPGLEVTGVRDPMPRKVSGGRETHVVVSFKAPCDQPLGTFDVRIRLRGPLGIEETVEATAPGIGHEGAQPHPCGPP
jgi:hypothetical protein